MTPPKKNIMKTQKIYTTKPDNPEKNRLTHKNQSNDSPSSSQLASSAYFSRSGGQRMKPSHSSNSPKRYVPQKMTPAEPPAPPKKHGYEDYRNRQTLEKIFSESKSVKTNKKRR